MKWVTEVIIVAVGAIYIFFADGGINLFLLWVYLALIYSFAWSLKLTREEVPKTPAFWGFLIGSNLFMLPIHVMWYLDIDGTKTGSSTSAFIFAVMPIWAFIFGGVIGGVSKILNKTFNNSKQSNA